VLSRRTAFLAAHALKLFLAQARRGAMEPPSDALALPQPYWGYSVAIVSTDPQVRLSLLRPACKSLSWLKGYPMCTGNSIKA
jgi:hypothetical protein